MPLVHVPSDDCLHSLYNQPHRRKGMMSSHPAILVLIGGQGTRRAVLYIRYDSNQSLSGTRASGTQSITANLVLYRPSNHFSERKSKKIGVLKQMRTCT